MDYEKIAGGIDTHAETNVLCILDSFGRVLKSEEFEANREGCLELLCTLGDPQMCLGVGVEATMSYGKNITRILQEAGFTVYEVLRPKRDKTRLGAGKDDYKDAERAAREVLGSTAGATPKDTRGWVGSLSALLCSFRIITKHAAESINFIKSCIAVAPFDVTENLKELSEPDLIKLLCRKRNSSDAETNAFLRAMRPIALNLRELRREKESLRNDMLSLIAANAPRLLDVQGCGPVCAAELIVAAGGNPQRFSSESAFAMFCGVSPIPASSGKKIKYRLNRGGNRRANWALYTIAFCRLRCDQRTKEYVEKRTKEGKSKKDIMRCLKRYIAREVYHALLSPLSPGEFCSGKELREKRESLALTQCEIAKVLNVKSARLSEIEREKSSYHSLRKAYQEYLDEQLRHRNLDILRT